MNEHGNLKIIVVDDSSEYAKSIAKMLTVDGYSIKGKVVANQGNFNQALESQVWDIVFIKLGLQAPLDIQSVAAKLEEQKLSIPIIAVSNDSNQEMQEQVIKSGAKGLVTLEYPELLKSIVLQETANSSSVIESKSEEITENQFETKGIEKELVSEATEEQPASIVKEDDVLSSDLPSFTVDEKLMCKQIENALNNDNFVTVYQPIVNLDAEPAENYEVLMRMLDDEGREILPNNFIGLAERAGLMAVIDRWVIERSIRLILQRREEGNKTRLFIKLSNNSLNDDDLWLWLSEKLIKAKLPKSSIVFEITEADAVKNQLQTKKLIPTLKRLNCRVALDHAGLDSEAQSFWSDLDLDYIKISGKLILSMVDSDEGKSKVRDLASFAKKNNILTIAQFIQDPSVLSHLYHNSINYVQGNFLQGPEAVLNYEFL